MSTRKTIKPNDDKNVERTGISMHCLWECKPLEKALSVSYKVKCTATL